MTATMTGERRSFPWRLVGWGGAILLLLLPLLAGAPWTLSDYLVAGTAFALVGLGFELAVRKSGNGWYRAGAGLALLTALATLWLTAAVGIIGSEGNAANLSFVGVVLIAVAGAVAARFEPGGMAKAMMVTAAIQAIIALVVLDYGLGAAEPPGLAGTIVLISSLAALWLVSARLFEKAAQSRN